MRELEKYAVKMGGGENHRFGLFDMYLVKENHIAAAGGINSALEKVFTHRDNIQIDLKVEVEVRDLEELKLALRYPVDRILLDNMSIEMISKAVELCSKKTKLEVSGGVNLSNVGEIARIGVDYISIGKLTHSVKNFDLSLLINRS
jgi:nicotinate-nucleotide pyrophosphorylase (carboxylating)